MYSVLRFAVIYLGFGFWSLAIVFSVRSISPFKKRRDGDVDVKENGICMFIILELLSCHGVCACKINDVHRTASNLRSLFHS